MSNFAGAAPAMIDYDPLSSLSESSGEETKLKLMHRSIDYGAETLPLVSIVPSYESQDNDPSAADLKFYFATDPGIEILSSAEKNQYNPAIIYSFVHNYFEYTPYFGSLKGAHLTYIDREGNDADQASLMISLLRASDIPARYVYGTIELGKEQTKNYFGVENESVIVEMLQKNGISAQAASGGVQFDHIWVEAYLNGKWIALDPSFKQYNCKEGMDLEALAADSIHYSSMLEDNIDISGDVVTHINVSGLDSSFTRMADDFRTLLNTKYANTTNSEIFGSREIVPYTDYYTLPATLPYTVVRVHGEYADLPDTFNHKLGIKFSGIDLTLNTVEVAGKRVSMFYEPSAEEDASYLNSSENLSELNALNINMSALLKVDGAVKAVGDPETLGSDQELELSFIAPGGQVDSYTRRVQTGAYFVIGLALQPVSTAHMNERVKRYEVTSDLLELDYFNVTKDELYGELLNLQALTFWGNYGLYNSIAARATGVVYTRHPSAMIVGTELDVSESEGFRSVQMSGVHTDIVRDIINPTAKDGDSAKSYAFLFTRGMTASAMEQSMLSLSYNVTAYSTSEIIKAAGDADIPIYTLDSSNWDGKEASLNISDSQKAIVKSAVDSGYSVIIPRDDVTIGNFTGSVFIVFDPETGASSYYGPDGRGWGWLDTLKTGLEAGISAVGTVAKGAAGVIADTGGKIAGVATGVISTVGEAINGTGSTIARVAKTALVGTINAAGYVITTAAGAAAGATAGAVAGVVIVTAFTADRLTELGKTVVDIYDSRADYEKSQQEYKEIQEELKAKKEQVTKEDLEKKKEELIEKKEELEQKKEEVEEKEDLDLNKDKKEGDDGGDDIEDDTGDDIEDDDFPGDDEEADEPDLDEDLDLDEELEPDDDPTEPSSPGGDHPDDTFSVASSKLRNADVTSLLIRNAYKKGYTSAVHLNEYRLGQLGMEEINDYTDNEQQENLYDLSASQADVYTSIVKNYDTIQEELELAPDVLMLQKGFYASAKAMVENRGIPVRLMRVQDFAAADTQELVHDTPVLFLPSGSLYGLDSSALIKNKFEEYVAEGGILVVMAQQHGYEFNMLPHNGTRVLGGNGWQEDQSCLYNAASISEYHAVVSGQPTPTLTVNIDGYFTSYPENSTIILKRNKNSMPAMLAYDYYKGKVLATSVYDDWAYFDGASTMQGELLVRDILTWAEDPGAVEAMLETDSIDIPVNISNKGEFPATKVTFAFMDPLGNLKVEDSIDLDPALEPGASTELNFACSPRQGETLGIWALDYVLESESDTAYTEYDARKIAVGKYVTSYNGYSTTPEITYSISSTNDHFAYGSDAVFTVTIWNNGNTDKDVTLKYCFPHHGWIEGDPQYGVGGDRSWYNLEKTVTVPAEGSTSFNHLLENVRSYDRFWSQLYDNEGKEIGSSTLGIYCFNPTLEIEFDCPSTFKVNNTNELNFTVKSTKGNVNGANVAVKLFDSSSNLLVSRYVKTDILSATPYSDSLEFTPEKEGTYNFVVEVTNGESRLGTGSLYITTKDRVVNLYPVKSKQPLVFNGTNNMIVRVENLENTSAENLALVTNCTGPDGTLQYSSSTPVQLGAGEEKEVNVPVLLGKPGFGTYEITYTLSEEENTLDRKEVFSNYDLRVDSYLSSSVFEQDKNETLYLFLSNGNAAVDLTVDISSFPDPGLGFFKNETEHLDPNEQKVISYEIPVGSCQTAGNIDLEFNVDPEAEPSAYTAKNSHYYYHMTNSKLEIDPALKTVAGGNLTFNITNLGPADTSAYYILSFINQNKIASASIRANETLTLEIPVPMVRAGNYTLQAVVKNMGTEKISTCTVPVHVEGFEIGIEPVGNNFEADGTIPIRLNNTGMGITGDLTVSLGSYKDSREYVKENVSLGAGQEDILEIPLSSDLPSGSCSLYIEFSNNSLNFIKYKSCTVGIEGLELDFGVEDEKYNTGDSLALKISNTGGIEANTNVSATLSGIDLGSQQASITEGEVSTLSFTLPGALNSGTYILKAKCYEENTGRTLDYSKTISVKGLDYKPSVDTFSAGRGEAINVSVNNTGIIPLSGSYDLVLSSETGEIASTNGSVSVPAGDMGVFSLTIPTSVLSGDYQILFSIEDQNGNEESVSAYIYVPDPSLVLNLNSREFLQGETIEAEISGLYSSDWNFTLSLLDERNNAVNSTAVFKPSGEITGESVLLDLIVPESIFTGKYVFLVKAQDLSSGTEYSTAADVRIEGITLTPEISTDSQEYLENDSIRYTAVLTAAGGVPKGNVSIRAYLEENSGDSEGLLLYSNYPVNSIVRFRDEVLIGTNGGLFKETPTGGITPVEDEELASMKISALDVNGGLLWVLSEDTVYSYSPDTGQLLTVLEIESEESEFEWEQHEESGTGLIRVDSSNQKIYMPNGWEGAVAYSYGGDETVTYYNSESSPLSGSVNDILVLPEEVLFIVDASYWDDELWETVYNYECHSLTDAGWDTYDSSDGLPSDSVLTAVSDGSSVYFITDAGISSRDIAGGSISNDYEFDETYSLSYVGASSAYNGAVLLYSVDGMTFEGNLLRYDASSNTLSVLETFTGGENIMDLAQGRVAVWFNLYSGLFAYNETEGASVRVPLNSFGEYGTPAGDDTCIVSATGKLLSIYDISSGTWTEMQVPVSADIASTALTSDYIWLISGNDLLRVDKASREFAVFNASNSDYDENGPYRIESCDEDLWVLTYGGKVSVYNTESEVSAAAANIPEIYYPEDFMASGNLVAILDVDGSIYEYDYGLDNTRTYNTGLSGVRKFAYSEGAYWITTLSDEWKLFRYDPDTENCSEEPGVNAYNLVSVGNCLYAQVSEQEGEFNFVEKIKVLTGNSWFDFESSLIPEDTWTLSMKAGKDSLILYGNGWIASVNGEGMQLVMDKLVSLDEFSMESSGEPAVLSWTGSYLAEKEGQLTFEVEAVSDYNQKTGTGTGSADVYARDYSLAMTTGKEYYRPGESVSIASSVSNNARAPLGSELVLLRDGREFDRQSFEILPFESERFEQSTSYSEPGTYTITAAVESESVSRDITVEAPQVQVNLNAPDLANRDSFIVGLTATNPGNVTAELGIEINNLSLETDFLTLSLAPGTSRALEFETAISGNTTIDVRVTGDLTERLTKFVEFGESASIDSECLLMYGPGTVEVPLNITNTGKYNTEFTASFAVNETVNETRTYSLGINQSINDTLAFDLGKGSYVLKASADIPLEFEAVPFEVRDTAAMDLVGLEVKAGSVGLTLNVSNMHPQLPFNGSLEIYTNFFNEEYPVNLSASENGSFDYGISLLNLPAGNYNVTVDLLEAGEVLERARGNFTVRAPEFSLTPDPANKMTLELGENTAYNFTVSNTGSVGEKATVNLEIPGIYEGSGSSWVESGENHVFSFPLKAPDDLSEGYYSVYYGLEGKEQNETRFYLEGANVTVASWLDQRAYLPGETAVLTMQVTNNGDYSLDLYSRTKYFDFDDVSYFTIGGGESSTFTVDIPVPETENKVFTSIYIDTPEGGESSGRSLYINSDYIHDRRDINGLRVSTEKQAYDAGEKVTMSANITRADHLTIEGPGLSYDGSIEHDTSIQFTVPNIPSGVYRYDITYGDTTGEYLLDIHGFELIVVAAEVELEKGGE